jgi:hypothetical protein
MVGSREANAGKLARVDTIGPLRRDSLASVSSRAAQGTIGWQSES